MAAGAAAPAASAADERLQPLSVRDLVRLERVSDLAASPDGRRLAYTLRTTDLEANRGRTAIWLMETGTRTQRAPAPLRLTDISANSSAAEWSADGRYIYFLSNRSGTKQVWRVAGGGAPRADAPGADALQVTNLPLDVGSFRVSPKGDRIVVSVEVFPDCPDLDCSKRRLDEAGRSKATGVLYKELFVRHWDTWSDGRRSQLFALSLDDVARGTPVNLTAGIGDVPGKPFGGREDYAFSPDGARVAFFRARNGRRAPGPRISTFRSRGRGRNTAQPDRGQSRLGMGSPHSLRTAPSSPTWPWTVRASKRTASIWCC